MTRRSYQTCLFGDCERKHRVHLKVRYPGDESGDDSQSKEGIYGYCYIHALSKVFSVATSDTQLIAWHAEGDPIPPPPGTDDWPDVLDATEQVEDQPLSPYAHTVPHEDYYVDEPGVCRKCGTEAVQFGGTVPVDEGADDGSIRFFKCPYCQREWETVVEAQS